MSCGLGDLSCGLRVMYCGLGVISCELCPDIVGLELCLICLVIYGL